MTYKEYRAHEGISKSQLFKIAKSPYHFKYDMDHPQQDTKALLFGRAIHKYLLKRDNFYQEFAVMPEINRRSKSGREEYEQFVLENADKEIVSQEEFEDIQKMAEVIRTHPVAAVLLMGEYEGSFFWTDETTGELCKCRPDCLTEYKGMKLIVDYKTADSCEDGHFERSCRNYGYKLQAGMYTEGLFQNTFEQYGFAFVVQEKTAPYAVRIYLCTPEYIAQGYDQFRELLTIYHSCKETGIWYGYEGPMKLYTELLEEVR